MSISRLLVSSTFFRWDVPLHDRIIDNLAFPCTGVLNYWPGTVGMRNTTTRFINIFEEKNTKKIEGKEEITVIDHWEN